MVHLRSGQRNSMLLDAGPLVVPPPPTPIKILTPAPPPNGSTSDPHQPGGGKVGGGTNGPGKGADPLADSPGASPAGPAGGRTTRGNARNTRGGSAATGGLGSDPLAEAPDDPLDGGGGGGGGGRGGGAGFNADEKEPGKIYISHKWSVNSQEWIQRMIQQFENAGLCYMQSDLGSDAYIDALEYHIARCEYVVLLVSREYAVALHGHQSRQHKEVGMGQQYGGSVVGWRGRPGSV